VPEKYESSVDENRGPSGEPQKTKWLFSQKQLK
jgi:hypothetical protein